MPISINSLKARTFSKLGQRGSIFGMAIFDIVEETPNLAVLTADLASLSGLDRFVAQHPDKFYNIGIAEQNMLGVAAGLCAEGYKPVLTTYATFLSLRSCEQVRHYMGYMNLNMVLVGSGAGFAMGFSGNTHYSIEDLAVMRAIPNIVVLSPSDSTLAVKVFEAAIKIDKPVYIRLTGGLNCPMLYKEDFPYEIGKAIKIRDGADIQIIATGIMVNRALQAAAMLEEKGISAEVIDMHTIKPLDTSAIALNKKLIVTIEEHNIIGGLGGAVAEHLTSKGAGVKLLRLGIQDQFLKSGDAEYLLEQCGLTSNLIAEQILETLK